ncbi:MAG: flagellar hook-associated protein FlgK, partial [Synergistaceae bacterium]|nr:flagellar hook-associated protein FlgK [Synergistaceae bacterium]
MSSTFGGLELGRSALNAFRLGMQTVGHNISNMNTEGYSRQRVNYTTVTPENIYGVGQVGNGMTISSIERIRDEFLDFQFRDTQSTLGYWEKINDLYDSIQNYISEPNSSGIRAAMDTFFTNVQTLQEKPEDTSTRQALVTSANSIGSMLNNLIDCFNTYNESINMEIKQSVDEANSMLYDVAALNREIYEAEALNQNANDLRDSRDVLIDKLSKMMDISYNEPKEYDGVKGEFFLSVNGKVLVQGSKVRELKAHAFMWDNQVYYDVQVAENEFDIVENPNIAEALATGAEGSYQLSVDRIANGVEWTIGGGNAHCLETYAVNTSAFEDNVYAGSGNDDDLVTFKVTTKAFSGGIVLNSTSDDVNTIAISRSDMNGNTLEDLRITITRIKDPTDDTEPYERKRDIWRLTDSNGNTFDTFYQDADPNNNISAENGSVLKAEDLVNFINSSGEQITAALTDENRIEITPPANSDQSVKAVCSNALLGTPAASKITTQVFPGGIVLDDTSDASNTISIPRNDEDGNQLSDISISMNRTTIGYPPVTVWRLSGGGRMVYSSSSTLTAQELTDFINTIPNTNISASLSDSNSIEITPLGSMREEKGSGIEGKFDIWVGNQGEANRSQVFDGGIITAGSGTFRIVVSGDDAQNHIDVTVDGGTLSTDLGNSSAWAGTVDDMVKFLNETFRSTPRDTGLGGLSARAYDTDNDGVNDQFEIKVNDDVLDYGILSVIDIDESGFAGSLFSESVSTKYTVNVTQVDTIENIRDKINSLGAGLTASTAKGYLSVTAGNDEIMTFKGDDELLRRLAFIREEQTITGGTRIVSNLNERGTILDADSKDIPYKLQFRSIDDEENPTILTVKIDRISSGWKLRAELDGESMKDVDGNSVFTPVILCTDDINTEDIQKFVNEAIEIANNLNPQIAGKVLETKTLNLNARDDNGILNFWTDNEKQLEVDDYSGMLGALTEAKNELTDVNMRTEPASLDDPLNISGSFRIQLGTQGTRVTSKNFGANPGKSLKEGEILTAVRSDDTNAIRKHTFRVGVSGDQVDISATWNASTNKWVLSSDLGTSETAGNTLTVKDLTDFLSATFNKSGSSDNPALSGMRVTAGKSSSGVYTQFYVESKDSYLVSISDIEGNLAETMGMVNTSPVI